MPFAVSGGETDGDRMVFPLCNCSYDSDNEFILLKPGNWYILFLLLFVGCSNNTIGDYRQLNW